MRLSDRQKQRREYLKKKAAFARKEAGSRLFLACLILATVLFGSAALLTFIAFLFTLAWDLLFWAFLTGVISLTLWYQSWKITRIVEKIEREEAAIRYVPPVTPDTLPDEELLVRGALEPEQEQNSVLLRAVENTDTPAEELLRATLSSMKGDPRK